MEFSPFCIILFCGWLCSKVKHWFYIWSKHFGTIYWVCKISVIVSLDFHSFYITLQALTINCPSLNLICALCVQYPIFVWVGITDKWMALERKNHAFWGGSYCFSAIPSNKKEIHSRCNTMPKPLLHIVNTVQKSKTYVPVWSVLLLFQIRKFLSVAWKCFIWYMLIGAVFPWFLSTTLGFGLAAFSCFRCCCHKSLEPKCIEFGAQRWDAHSILLRFWVWFQE